MTSRSACKLVGSAVAALLLAACGGGGGGGSETVRYGHPELTTIGNPSGEPYGSNFLLGQAVTVEKAIRLTHLGVNAMESGPNVILALYSDSAGLPSALLASTSAAALQVGANEVAVTTPIDLAAGTYWIMAVYDANATIANDSATDVPLAYVDQSFGAALPSSIASPQHYTSQNTALYVVGTR